MFTQHEDFSIVVNQENYIQEKLFEINLEKQRKKKRYTFCDEKEITQLRASVGALAWLAKESRPDIAGRVALLQQVFPRPRIKDIIEANSITHHSGSPEATFQWHQDYANQTRKPENRGSYGCLMVKRKKPRSAGT